MVIQLGSRGDARARGRRSRSGASHRERHRYGAGYLAACLAALAFEPARVVEALLDGRPPPAVAHLSPKLAKVSVASSVTTPDATAADAARQKARVRAMERAEADEAALREVYDDDYDDRYPRGRRNPLSARRVWTDGLRRWTTGAALDPTL